MPTNYAQINDYSDELGTTHGLHLDQDFTAVAASIVTVTDSLALIQRGDGRLQDVSVETHTLSPEVLNLMGGFNLRGVYTEGEVYAVNDIASDVAYTYVCTVAHTAGAVLDPAKWIQFGFTSGSDAAAAAAAAQVSAASALVSSNTATAQAAIAVANAATTVTDAATSTSNATAANNSALSAFSSATNASASAVAANASAVSATASAAAAAAVVAPAIHAATSKVTPVDADEIPLSDSAASWALKKLTWANLVANLSLSVTGVQIQPVTASVGASALTIVSGALALNFRSTTPGDGTVSTVAGTPANLVVPSGVPLGSVNAKSSRLVVLAMNFAGALELAVTNIASGMSLDETGTISTEAIGVGCTFTGSIAVTTGILTLTTGLTGSLTLGQALSGTNVSSGTVVLSLLSGSLGANGSTYQTNQFTAAASTTITGKAGLGVYSTAARTSLAYRVLGIVESTQATAGTWATNPSLVQGAGGNALTAMSSYGYGQKWTDVLASRAAATTYYNATGKLITVRIKVNTSGSDMVMTIVQGGTLVALPGPTSGNKDGHEWQIPAGASYTYTGQTPTHWFELR